MQKTSAENLPAPEGPKLTKRKQNTSTLQTIRRHAGGGRAGLAFDGATLCSAAGYSVLNRAPCFRAAICGFRGETGRCSEAGRVPEVRAREPESFA